MVKLYEAWGYTAKLSEWAKMFDIEVTTLRHRIYVGMPFEEALTKPKGRKYHARQYTHDGETHTAKEWSEILGITLQTFCDRLRRNVPEDQQYSPYDLRTKEGGKRMMLKQKESDVVRVMYVDKLGDTPSVTTIKASDLDDFKSRHRYSTTLSKCLKSGK